MTGNTRNAEALLILPWCHPSTRMSVTNTTKKVTVPEKRVAKVQGFSFLVWNTSTKIQESFSVLLLWSLQMLWKCSWWRQACKRCCPRSCWGSRVVHKLKIHAFWRLHQISLSPCFLEVKMGILTVQIYKETISKSPHSRRVAICTVAFISLICTSAMCFITLWEILLRHHTFSLFIGAQCSHCHASLQADSMMA